MFDCIKMIFFTALTIFICIGTANTAVGPDNCKDVTIKIINNLQQEIKVTELKYYDYDAQKWRNEYTWTALKVAPGMVRRRKRNLEHVDDDRTKVRIHYKRHRGGMSWTGITTLDSDDFTCHDGCQVSFVIED